MSNVQWKNVQDLHDPIPDTDSGVIGDFITDAEDIVKAKLAPYVEQWTDSTEPRIVRVIIKHMACWTELKKLYGSQVEDFHEWVRDFKELPWDLIHEIIDAADEGRKLPPGFVDLVADQVRSNTKLYTKIFDLGSIYSQKMHARDDDIRYGEAE